MRTPGFTADSILSTGSRSLARSVQETGGGNGPIVIDGRCFCAHWERVCFGGTFCLPWPIPGHGCYSAELCFDFCTVIRCVPR